MTEAFERERELNARERIEQLEAQLEACKDINGGITTENIRLNGKYRKLLEWYQQLEAENAALKKWNLEYDDKNAALRALLKEAAEFVRWADTFNLDDATARRNWEELKRKLEAHDE